MADLIRGFPLNKRTRSSSSQLVSYLRDLLRQEITSPDRSAPKEEETNGAMGLLNSIFNFGNQSPRKRPEDGILRAIVNILLYKSTLQASQVHAVCHSKSLYLREEGEVHHELGFRCAQCSKEVNHPFLVCIVCAHRCHSGHFLTPLGFDVFSCNCSSKCRASRSLPLPQHIRLSDDYACDGTRGAKFMGPNICSKEIDGRLTYLSSDHETNTLICQTPLCQVFSKNADAVNESVFSHSTAAKALQERPSFWANTRLFSETSEAQERNSTLAYFEVTVAMGGVYDQIAVGVTNNEEYPLQEFAGYKEDSLAYHADEGNCYVNGRAVGYGGRYGSFDVVGCGVTRYGDVYFTHNGMLLPLINMEMQGKIYPLVSLRGRYASVRINLGPNFEFDHERVFEMPNPHEALCYDETLLPELGSLSSF